MGWRFRKSFKIAPGIKFNLNKKSTSVTFGGKGAHYTINSKGSKTKSFGIPGTGLYYTETTHKKTDAIPPDTPTPPPEDTNFSFNDNRDDKKKKGCLFYLLAFFLICLGLLFFPVLWIPAVVCIIFFAVKKDARGTKKRNILISLAVMILSFIAFANIDTSDSLSALTADWDKTTYDVSETAVVKLTPSPSEAEITSLELSDSDIAELDFSDGNAVITFKEAGEATLFFTANGDTNSNTTVITVTDKAAEEAARLAEEEVQRKAEEEAKAAEEARKEVEAAEQAQKEAEEAAAKQAEEEARVKAEQEAAAQAQAEQEAANQANAQQAQQPQEQTVWIPQSGSKYHSNPSCSNMKNPTEVTISEAQSRGYEPCKKCY